MATNGKGFMVFIDDVTADRSSKKSFRGKGQFTNQYNRQNKVRIVYHCDLRWMTRTWRNKVPQVVEPNTSVQGMPPLRGWVEDSVKSGAGNVASGTIVSETTAKYKREKADATVGKALKLVVATL